MAKTHLIVSGVARSGTTALAELLNAHPLICVGIERFKFRYLRENDYSLEFFERGRFFDFRKGDTNLTPDRRPAWAPTYEEIDRKWDKARVIGDKVPDLTPVLGDFLAAQPQTRCIYVLRNLKDVGLSWQARANRTRDAWPVTKDFAAACESWALQQEQLHELLKTQPALADRMLLLDYDQMYAPEARTEQAILGFLGLPPAPAFADKIAEHRDFAARKESRKLPDPFVEAYKAVDQTAAKALRKEARLSTDRWADSAPAAPAAPAAVAPMGRKARRLAAGRPKGAGGA